MVAGDVVRVLAVLLKRYPYCRGLSMNWAKHREPPWKVLIGTILSARSRDEQTSKAAHALFRRYPTLEKLSKASLKDIKETIKTLGLYKQKAKRVYEVSKIVAKKYKGKVPQTEEELMALPGVGQKTADCVLLYGFGKYVIPVDVHVHRLANLFGWVKTKKPEETKVALERKIKGKERAAVNCALVSLGQETGYSAEKMNEILGKHLTKAAYSKLKPGQPANRKKKDGRLPIEALGESMR